MNDIYKALTDYDTIEHDGVIIIPGAQNGSERLKPLEGILNDLGELSIQKVIDLHREHNGPNDCFLLSYRDRYVLVAMDANHEHIKGCLESLPIKIVSTKVKTDSKTAEKMRQYIAGKSVPAIPASREYIAS